VWERMVFTLDRKFHMRQVGGLTIYKRVFTTIRAAGAPQKPDAASGNVLL
jgi:hypothetical protein